MPYVRRSFTLNPLGVLLRNDSWLTPTLRASAITLDGLVWDSRSLPAPPNDGRAFVYVVIEGRYFAHGRVYEAGDAVFFPSYVETFSSPCFATGSPHRAVALRLHDRDLAGIEASSVPRDLALAAYEAIVGRAADPTAPLEALGRALGLGPRVCPRETSTPHAHDEGMAAALSTALCGPRGLPHLVDLDLPNSSRHARRRLDAFLSRYAMPFRHFRELRASFTLTATVSLLGRPELRLVDIAQAIGFSSAPALCHALERAGLDSPGAIRMRFAEARSEIERRTTSCPRRAIETRAADA